MDTSSISTTSVATGVDQGSLNSNEAAGSTRPDGSRAVPANAQNPSPEQIAQAVKQINEGLSQYSQNLSAINERDPTTGIDVVKSVDQDSGKTISQYPSKAAIAIAQSIQDFTSTKGQLFSTKA
jgi:uncharacterized FlaG/YvyC family protein